MVPSAVGQGVRDGAETYTFHGLTLGSRMSRCSSMLFCVHRVLVCDLRCRTTCTEMEESRINQTSVF